MVLLEQITDHFATRGLTLHPWQIAGLQWMISREADHLTDDGGGGILADEPGLGKTYTSLGLLVDDVIRGIHSRTLVVVPTSVLHQWVAAGNSLLGDGSVELYYGNNRELSCNSRLVVTSYGILQRDDELLDISWDRVILDEIHYIKNYRGKTAQKARKLFGNHRWGLTGTPFQNTSEELASLFRFVCGIRSGAQHVRVNHELDLLVRERLLRRTKDEVLDMVQLTIETTEVDFRTEEERTIYQTLVRNVASEYRKLLGTPGNHSLETFELLLRLRQCSQHPELVLRGLMKKNGESGDSLCSFRGASSKMLGLFHLLSEHPTEPSLVFSPFRQELEMLERELRDRGYQVYRLDGSCNGFRRERMLCDMRTWLATGMAKPMVMLLQSRAGGVGLNLQEFSRVYLMTPDWNPSNDLQAIARSHRLGQKRPVYVKTLVLRDENSIDHRILRIQRRKSDEMTELLGESMKLDQLRRVRFNSTVWDELFLCQ